MKRKDQPDIDAALTDRQETPRHDSMEDRAFSVMSSGKYQSLMLDKLGPFQPVIDDSTWFGRPIWKLHQAICLAVGLEPRDIDPSLYNKLDQFVAAIPTEKREEWSTLYTLAKAATITGSLDYDDPAYGSRYLHRQVDPAAFVKWAKGKGIPLPDKMKALIHGAVTGALLADHAKTIADSVYVDGMNNTAICTRVAERLVRDGKKRTRGTVEIDAEYVRHSLLFTKANKWTRPK